MSSKAPLPKAQPFSLDMASLGIGGVLLIAIMMLHLIPALFAGLVTFALIQSLSNAMAGKLSNRRGKLLAVALIAIFVIGVLSAAVFSVVSLLKADAGVSALFEKMASILDDASSALPASLADSLPSGSEELRIWAVEWLREHSTTLQAAGKEAGMSLIHTVIGVVIGALVAFHDAHGKRTPGPLAQRLLVRIARFTDAFRKVVFAQFRISLINTAITASYLWIVLPLCGIHLPFTKTMLTLTFILGLIPVVGNLISNTVVVIVSVSHSLHVAISSLVFLVAIHKAEYFLNAQIIGHKIRSEAWELLMAMLLMESMFGIAGVIAAPVFYAYLKSELDSFGLI